MAKSSIEWTQATWNPVTGCDKVSPGCKHCYAETLAHRLKRMGEQRYQNGFKLTLQPSALTLPLEWKTPKVIFVNSMSDLFHKDIEESYIRRVFETMEKASWHTFQVLTKRSERLRELAPRLPWPKNVWMGVSVENEQYTSRVRDLVQVPAAVRFLSIEPLLGPIPALPLEGIDWVIVGGESGPGARLMREKWVLDIRQQCQAAKVAFFFKQWGGVQKKRKGRELEGRTWDEMPVARPEAPPKEEPKKKSKSLEERLAAAKLKTQQLHALLQKKEARKKYKVSKEERAKDTRRKILVGSAALGLLAKGEALPRRLSDLLKELTRDDDRALFDLPPLNRGNEQNE
jgi:protein gp37